MRSGTVVVVRLSSLVLPSLLFVLALVAPTRPASAQSFNLDVGDAASTPGDDYGGAAASPGRWQPIAIGTAPLALTDVTGGGGVTLTASRDRETMEVTGSGPSDDDARLLEDFVPLDTNPLTLTFDGLVAGRYQVLTYAFAATPGAITYVGVGEDTQAVAGEWSGGFEVFVTHALQEIELADGDPLVVSLVGVDQGLFSGLQLVRLPDDPPPEGEPQGFNLDGGAELGEPSPSYGGAANQPGQWMPLSFAIENPVKLVGLDGVVSGVTLTANLPYGPAFDEHPGPSGDDEKLLEDYLDLHTTPGTFELRGVPPGDYLVYTYAWAPDDDRYRTFVTIDDESQTIGGPWPGALTQGVTHALHKVTVPPSGKLTIHTFGTKGTLNGIQIVPAGDDPVEPGPETAEAEDIAEDVESVEAGPDADDVTGADQGPEAMEELTSGDTAPGSDADAGREDVAASDTTGSDADAASGGDTDVADTGARGRGDDGCHGGADASWLLALIVIGPGGRRALRARVARTL